MLQCILHRGIYAGQTFDVFAHTRDGNMEYAIISFTEEQLAKQKNADQRFDWGGLNPGEEVLYEAYPNARYLSKNSKEKYRWVTLGHHADLIVVETNKDAAKFLLRK